MLGTRIFLIVAFVSSIIVKGDAYNRDALQNVISIRKYNGQEFISKDHEKNDPELDVSTPGHTFMKDSHHLDTGDVPALTFNFSHDLTKRFTESINSKGTSDRVMGSRRLRKRAIGKTQAQRIKFMLGDIYDIQGSGSYNSKLNQVFATLIAPLQQYIQPFFGYIQARIPNQLQLLLKSPRLLLNIFPRLKYLPARYTFQALPVRLIQSAFPLLSTGEIALTTILKALIPLPIRLQLAYLPLPTGEYNVPKTIGGIFQLRSIPRILIQLPDQTFGTIAKFTNFYPLVKFPINDRYRKMLWNLTPRMFKTVTRTLHLLTIHILPHQFLIPDIELETTKAIIKPNTSIPMYIKYLVILGYIATPTPGKVVLSGIATNILGFLLQLILNVLVVIRAVKLILHPFRLF